MRFLTMQISSTGVGSCRTSRVLCASGAAASQSHHASHYKPDQQADDGADEKADLQWQITEDLVGTRHNPTNDTANDQAKRRQNKDSKTTRPGLVGLSRTGKPVVGPLRIHRETVRDQFV
jgi:hypothetical protein